MDLQSKVLFVIDMDSTLLESIDPSNSLYKEDKGTEVSYSYQGREQKVKFQVRPFASEFLSTLVNLGEYIIFSSGVQEYVEAVMQAFSHQIGIHPQRVLTRRDMIATFSQPDKKFKSVQKLALESAKEILFIVEDNPNLVIPKERKYVLEVKPWFRMQESDRDLYWLSRLISALLTENAYQNYLLPSSFKKVVTPAFILRGN
jgi:hypothetical protein